MIEARKQPMPKVVAGPKRIPGKVAMMTDTIPSQDRIRERAYGSAHSAPMIGIQIFTPRQCPELKSDPG